MTLPAWANFSPSETRGTRRIASIPAELQNRIAYVANMPGMTELQRATLLHRSRTYLDRFRSTPTVPPELTLAEAVSLFHAIGLNGLSGPFLADQIKRNFPAPQLTAIWGPTLTKNVRARAATGRASWWRTK